jgi:hypothetical protein
MGERHSHPFLKLSFANIGHDTNNPGNIPTTQWEVLLRYILRQAMHVINTFTFDSLYTKH